MTKSILTLCLLLSFSALGNIKYATGLKRDPAKFHEFISKRPRHFMGARVGLPAHWDLTPKVAPPLNQGNCGSCWDFSILKAFWSEFLLSGKQMEQPAANYLLNNCSGVRQANKWACGGGDFDAGLGMLLPAHGPWAESRDPYRQRMSRCQGGLPSLGLAMEWVVVGDPGRPPSFEQLASANYNNGKGHVLSIDVSVSGSWPNYRGGIYSGRGFGINHMIDLVGYDCETSVDATGMCQFDSNGQPIHRDGWLKVQNNWGTTWGEGGYMRTRWGANQVADTAMYFMIQ